MSAATSAPSSKLAMALVSDLDIESATSLKAAFVEMFGQAEEWAKKAALICVTDESQKREMKLARESRLALREIRTRGEATRKRLKEDSLRKGKAIDGIANVLKALIEPIEAHLLEQETFAERAEAARRDALRDARAAALRALGVAVVAMPAALGEMAEGDWESVLGGAQAAHEARVEAARVAQEARAAAQADQARRDAEREAATQADREAMALRENERLRREATEREERIAAERAQAQREQAEARARAERDCAAREAAELAAKEEQEHRRRLEVELVTARAGAPANGAAPLCEDVPAILPNGSASATERTIACPSWLSLPRVNTETPYSAGGHGKHAYLRAILSGVAQEVALASVAPEHRETCARIDWQKLCGDLASLETEVAYAIDVKNRTARRLGTNVGRDYEGAAARAGQPLGEWEIPGSLDVTGKRRGDGLRVVADAKTGFRDVTAVEENGQGLFFAAVFVLLEGASEVMVRMAKIKENGDVWNDVATFGAWEVDGYLDTLEEALVRAKASRRVYLAGGTPDFHEGPWCGYCAGANACPAKTRLARAMLGELQTFGQAIEAMTDEDAGRAYERAHDQIAPVLKRVLEALKARARRAPYLLPSGKLLREAPYEKASHDFDAAIALARGLGATDAQIRTCSTTIVVRPVIPCKGEGAKALGKRSA